MKILAKGLVSGPGSADTEDMTTRHPITTTEARRRDNALAHIARGVNTPAYRNARRILVAEFGYTNADLLRAARVAR